MRVTFYIIIITIIVYIMQLVFGMGFTELFSLVPVDALSGYIWQFITYMFLHDPSSPVHIMANMVIFLIFGLGAEAALGWRKFIFVYIVSGIGSAVLHVALTGVSTILLLGASGAVFGVLAAYAVLYPRSWVWIPPGIPLPAIAAIAILALIELAFGFFGLQEGVANFGHLGGIITGVAIMLYWRHGRSPKRRKTVKEYEFIWE